jgi:aryl-alcohol dehydrogenase-like predicted oxidoreductase
VGKTDQQTVENILDHFYSQGGNFVDTSSNYQFQQSEQWIGEWMEKRGNRDQMVIATKFSTNFIAGQPEGKIMVNYQGNGTKSMRISVEASLKKLRTDYIDIVRAEASKLTTQEKLSLTIFPIALHPLVGLLDQHPRGDAVSQPSRRLWQGSLPWHQ